MADFRIRFAGESALVLEFEEAVDPAVNARAIAVARAIEAEAHAGVRDVVTAYRSIAVYFDPLRTRLDDLVAGMERKARQIVTGVEAPRPLIEIPVSYGGQHGPDLSEVARWAHCSEQDVIQRHSEVVYRVYMLGFVPGFAYMGSVDPRIGARRRSSPRLRVPAGSVGIAGFQTGIYPLETPGGWQLIGRTSVKPFDPGRLDPFLFSPGDSVRFVPIDVDEFRERCRS